jgi:hypothetical protein
MLPLSADQIPTSAAELAEALTRGLLACGITPRSVQAVGDDFPKIESLVIDVTEAKLTRDTRPLATIGEVASGADIGRFELTGTPLFFEKTALDLRIDAERVKAHFRGIPGDGALVLDSADTGALSLTVAKDALEALVQSFAAEAAAKQGLEVRKTTLTLTQEGPRAVSFRVEVTAKIFVMSAALSLSGRIEIDGELNARFVGLALGGDAMITKLAGGYVRPYLDRLEGRVFPLLAFSLGGLKLQDVEFQVEPAIEIRARLGTTA